MAFFTISSSFSFSLIFCWMAAASANAVGMSGGPGEAKPGQGGEAKT